MKKNLQYIVTAAAWLAAMYVLFSGFSYRADFKVGYVVSPTIFAEYQEAIEVEQKIQAETREKEAEWNAKNDQFQKEVAQFQNQSLMLSDAKRAETEKKLGDIRNDLLSFQEQHFSPGGTLEQRWNELMKPVAENVQKVIDEIGLDEGYDLIFDTKLGSILFAKEEYNLTDRVLEELKKQK